RRRQDALMAEPLSWLLVEPGWRVLAAGGEEVGRVEEVTGDSGADIFDGLAFASSAFARPRYVPAEQVAEITDGAVHLALDAAAVASLGEYEEPAESIDVEPDAASRLRRLEEHVVAPEAQSHPEPLLRRVLAWFGLAGRR